MLKWAAIIGVAALILGGLILAGVLELAAGLIQVVFFLVVALAVVLAIAGWLAKRRSS